MITKFKIFEKTERGDDVVYTLKTKAISYLNWSDRSKFREYNVNILYPRDNSPTMKEKGYVLTLSIEGTPGCWYIKTLLDDSKSIQTRLSISGNDWYCDNWYEIRRELIQTLPLLNNIVDNYEEQKMFNL